jgi:magnesium chelatase subunit D
VNLHALALGLLATAPHSLGAVRLRASGNPEARDRWLARLREALPPATPWLRAPASADDDRLFGGLDVAATLAQGKPVHQAGLLRAAQGGVLLLPLAERMRPERAAAWARVIDDGAAVCLIALDDALPDDEATLPPALAERIGLDLSFESASSASLGADEWDNIAQARSAGRHVARSTDVHCETLVQAAEALGVGSVRAVGCALRVACASAAGFDRAEPTADDLALAVQLVLAPRATRWPEPPAESAESEQEPEREQTQDEDDDTPEPSDAELAERVLEAALASLPPGLLAQLATRAQHSARRASSAGRSGQRGAAPLRGRLLAARQGAPRGGARLCLISTLRAAAPWQPWRKQDATRELFVHLRPSDLHVRRHEAKRGSATVFVIDASGSAAMHRLAEAKGAVELLLADCYARRDKVAVIGFRGQSAELLLPPTRSLVRAKRQLAGLPGGGGTPLAAGIAAAQALAEQLLRAGATPSVVLLTDGRANVSRSGEPGRAAAQADALLAARQFAQGGHAAVLIDTAPQSSEPAVALAQALRARYLALPQADARLLHRAVNAP